MKYGIRFSSGKYFRGFDRFGKIVLVDFKFLANTYDLDEYFHELHRELVNRGLSVEVVILKKD